MMTISLDWIGSYLEHKPLFDELAKVWQVGGNRIGIITNERESRRQEIVRSLGFVPDFIHLWAQEEFIVNGFLWKCQQMDKENSYMHFDDDAAGLKVFTQRWVVKTLNSADTKKF